MLSESTLKKARRVGKMLNSLAAVSPALAGKVAFRIFCTPRRLPLRDNDRSFLKTAEHGTVYVDRIPVRTYTWRSEKPDAQTVLLLHGWESSSARWRKYVKALREAGYTVQAFDAPANGNSGGTVLNVMLFARALQVFLEHHSAPYAIISHSLGGGAAVMSMALSSAARPQKLVLMGVFAESSRVIRDFGKIMGINDIVLEGVFREIERRSGLPISEYSVQKKAALLNDVQGFVLHDLNDEVAPVAEGRLIAGTWLNAQYLETEGLGHRMQDKSVVEAVMRFIKGA